MSRMLLLSGGMDSISIAFWKRPEYALTIDYGQVPAEGEIRAAKAAAEDLNINHIVLRVPELKAIGSGDLAGQKAIAESPGSEWWPYRNQLLLTLAAGIGLPRGVKTLMIGSLATDGYHADGSVGFVEAIDRLFSLQEGAVRVEAPAIGLTAPDLVRTSRVPKSILAWAHSCHVASYACGDCGGCRKHYRTLEALGEPPY